MWYGGTNRVSLRDVQIGFIENYLEQRTVENIKEDFPDGVKIGGIFVSVGRFIAMCNYLVKNGKESLN